MKKLMYVYALLLGMTTGFLTSCERSSEPTFSAFPKKQLIEEFTGQACGYCPYGMDCLHEFMGNDTNYVLILHHYGYQADNFSVAGSKTITSALKVDGAPSMAINRAKTKYGTSSSVVFHPGYLEDVSKSQFADSTYASIVIVNSYNTDSRELKIHVSGQVAKADVSSLNLTVLVKESGMIDAQADYYNTFEGWQEFRHCNAVRAFLTAPKGDEVSISKYKYSADYTLTLDSKWVPENCMVVAFLSESFQPVIQAEQKPVVASSKGGVDILHGGIKAVPVPDYYPEPNATDGPVDFSGNETDTISTTYAYYQDYASQGITVWYLQAYSANDPTTTIEGTPCIPFADITLFAPYDASHSVPTGTFAFNTTQTAGSAFAGYRNDAKFEIGGSMFYFTSKSYLLQGYLYPFAQWLITSGNIIIADNGWSLSGKALNGADLNIAGSSAISVRGAANAPARRMVKRYGR